MRKILILAILAFMLSFVTGASANQKLITLGGVKIGQAKVSEVWGSAHLTCKSENVILSGVRYNKVFYWIDSFVSNEMSPNTYVSKDTICVYSSSDEGSAFYNRYWNLQYRFLMTWAPEIDPHRDLMSVWQGRGFSSDTPGLWCRAREVGFYAKGLEKPPRFTKVVFTPYRFYTKFFSSRDLVCTTNLLIINQWKGAKGWSILNL